MGMRAITVLILIMSANVMGVWMDLSGFNDQLGVERDLGLSDDIEEFDKSDDDSLTSRDAGVSDYLGFTVSALQYLVVGVLLLGAFENALYVVGFPAWFIVPVMYGLLRPIYFLAILQILRGVVGE